MQKKGLNPFGLTNYNRMGQRLPGLDPSDLDDQQEDDVAASHCRVDDVCEIRWRPLQGEPSRRSTPTHCS